MVQITFTLGKKNLDLEWVIGFGSILPCLFLDWEL